MKSQSYTRQLLVLLGISLLISCSDENTPSPSTNGGIDVLPSAIQLDEFTTDEGQIGIIISARAIARKGYSPSYAEVTFSDNRLEAMDVALDEFNNEANISFANSDLDDELESALKEGISVDIKIKDNSGQVLAESSLPKVSFTSSPPIQDIKNPELEDQFTDVDLREGALHYLQLVTPANEVVAVPSSERYPHATDLGARVLVRDIASITYPSEFAEKYSAYEFLKVPDRDNMYTITTYDGNNRHNLYYLNGELRVQTRANIARNKKQTDPLKYSNYWFTIEKNGPGKYTLTPNGSDRPFGLSGSDIKNSGNTSEIYFRILAVDIDWDIQAIDSKFMRPIMPPSTTSSAYNSTLRNCSSGTLTQTVGESTSLTTTETVEWSESMSVSTTDEASISLTLSAEAETSFFGNGGKTSASVTGSYTYTKTQTQTNTRSASLTTEKSVQVSVSREVGVPSGTAISVADIYQQYENVVIPFVQRFRIQGRFQKSGNALSSREIITQFAFNSFTGVVSEIGDGYIEVTVRGTTEIDRIVETTTETRDIPNACN